MQVFCVFAFVLLISPKHQNGHAGVPLSIHVPMFPWFHPKDCLLILALSDPDLCTTFAYWTKDEWKVSNTSIELRDIESTIFLRLKDVTECVGGPASTNPLSTINVHLWLQVRTYYPIPGRS